MTHDGDRRKGDRRKYVPTKLDLAWAATNLELIAEEGLMLFPLHGLIFRVYHKERKIVLLFADLLSDPEVKEVFERTKVVFAELGYSVEVKQ